MPCHSDRVRSAGLPNGYQFGDASRPDFMAYIDERVGAGNRVYAAAAREFVLDRWRAPHENRAERLTSAAFRITQAQMAAERGCTQYGEFYVPGGFPHDGDAASDENPPRADDVWDQQPIPERGWNAIEGEHQ